MCCFSDIRGFNMVSMTWQYLLYKADRSHTHADSRLKCLQLGLYEKKIGLQFRSYFYVDSLHLKTSQLITQIRTTFFYRVTSHINYIVLETSDLNHCLYSRRRQRTAKSRSFGTWQRACHTDNKITFNQCQYSYIRTFQIMLRYNSVLTCCTSQFIDIINTCKNIYVFV